ncbi:SMP-30/gluconolactonase/LRE family protein [Alkalicoccus chagannorensis]|uniref:SMP-30/gluconolactonase/LRE family protein n=1 Tax=Alkalicoccus chagannorensis TaxID=427072 RepID=UPI00047D359E|nr:SMP-30/gluconolactonase/LRE family protein [Alkalicoccus chagannorensis]
MAKPELIYDANALLAEGPCWNEEEQLLLWVDIDGEALHFLDPLGADEAHPVGEKIGSAVFGTSGSVYMCTETGFYHYDRETREKTHIYDPEKGMHGNRFNDGKADPAGRYWSGTMVLEGEDNQAGLYCMGVDQRVHQVLDKVTVSNGMAWNEPEEIMYYIDTPRRTIRRFQIDLESGRLGELTCAFEVPEHFGFPDGMTIDADGRLWVAFFEGGCVRCIDPEEGRVVDKIELPASRVTSCCFGGRDMDELYITTARGGLSDEELEEQPHAGGIFRLKLDVRGARSYRFQDS